MALALILRNAKQLHGYPSLLKYTPMIYRSTSSLIGISNKTSSDYQKSSILKVNNKILVSPTRQMSAKDHTLMWKLEKVFTVTLLGLLPATIILAPNQILDNVTATVVVLHIHWGIEAICQDYVRPIIFGNLIPKLALVIVYVISAVTLGGLLFFNYSDIGLGAGIKKFWKIE